MNPTTVLDMRVRRPTMLQDDDLVEDKLTAKAILVTGGTDGLGGKSVRQLAKTGATVWFTARNADKARKVKEEILEEVKMDIDLKNAEIDFVIVDNTSLKIKSHKAGAEDFLKKTYCLNVLVCNAGMHVPLPPPGDQLI